MADFETILSQLKDGTVDAFEHPDAFIYRNLLPKAVKEAPVGGTWDQISTAGAKAADTALLGIPSAASPSIKGFLAENRKNNPTADTVGEIGGALIPVGGVLGGTAAKLVKGGDKAVKLARIAGDIGAAGVSGYTSGSGEPGEELENAGTRMLESAGGHAAGAAIAAGAGQLKKGASRIADFLGERYANSVPVPGPGAGHNEAKRLADALIEAQSRLQGPADVGLGNVANRATRVGTIGSVPVTQALVNEPAVMAALAEAQRAAGGRASENLLPAIAQGHAGYLMTKPAFDLPVQVAGGLEKFAPLAGFGGSAILRALDAESRARSAELPSSPASATGTSGTRR
jgi:hypothetical protein